MNRSMCLSFVVVIVLLWSAGCAAPQEETLQVCTVSFGRFMETEGGLDRGLEYDILAGFARSEGLALDINRQGPVFFSKENERLGEVFQEGPCDVYAATITVTPERAEYVDFSEPYFPVRSVLVQRQGDAAASVEDLRGKRIFLPVEGGRSAALARNVPGVEIVTAEDLSIDDLDEARGAAVLTSGEADAFPIDSWTAADLLPEYPELTVSVSLSEIEYFAFAMPKGSLLKPKLDAHIREIMSNGEYYRSLTANFGEDLAETVATMLGASTNVSESSPGAE